MSDKKKQRIFARLMARELTAEELASVVGGMMIGGGGGGGGGLGGTCSYTISGSPRCADDSVTD